MELEGWIRAVGTESELYCVWSWHLTHSNTHSSMELHSARLLPYFSCISVLQWSRCWFAERSVVLCTLILIPEQTQCKCNLSLMFCFFLLFFFYTSDRTALIWGGHLMVTWWCCGKKISLRFIMVGSIRVRNSCGMLKECMCWQYVVPTRTFNIEALTSFSKSRMK